MFSDPSPRPLLRAGEREKDRRAHAAPLAINSRLRPPDATVTLASFPRSFSSPPCGRTMLRRPGDCLAVRLGEGCSSTAVGRSSACYSAVWGNPQGSAAVDVGEGG